METTTKSYIAFYFLYKLLEANIPKKQASNIISATHALGTTALSYLYLNNIGKGYFSILRYFSTAYFLHDSVQLAYTNKWTMITIGYLYHHIASMFLLNGAVEPNIIGQIFFWAELSNLPTYPLYHYLHQTGNHKKKIRILRILQKIMYTCIRIPVLTQMISRFLQERGRSNIPGPLMAILPVYFMGLGWSYKILLQN
jgi:hypothetical protein